MHCRRTIWLTLFLMLLLALPAAAQEEEPAVALRLRRDFGYGSGLRMQGRFSMRVTAPEDVVRVDFVIDEHVIGVDDEAPFALQFSTGGYPDGWHTMQAIGYTAAGEALPSNTIRREFVPASTANLFLVVVVGISLGLLALRYFLTRNESGANYGLIGGTVCPHCGRPFAYHIWSFNLLAGRFDRCRHCGKWSFTRRVAPQQLAEAERELAGDEVEEPAALSAEERLRRELDASRFEDLP